MLKVTLDTNCFFEYYERNPQQIERLIHYAEKGYIEMAMTTRVMSDTLDKRDDKEESLIWNKIQSFPLIKTIGTVFRLGVSRLGSEDILVSEDHGKMIDYLSEIMEGAQTQDIDHIFGHIIGNRDIFITSDSHFLCNHEELRDKFSVLVLKPEDAVKEIEKEFLV